MSISIIDKKVQEKSMFIQSEDSLNMKTELGEVISDLNADVVDGEKMTSIDMKTRLFSSEISGVMAIDTLVAFGFFPRKCLILPRKRKRLNVSLNGLGRQEIVQIAAGNREQEMQKLSLFDKIKGKAGALPPQPPK